MKISGLFAASMAAASASAALVSASSPSSFSSPLTRNSNFQFSSEEKGQENSGTKKSSLMEKFAPRLGYYWLAYYGEGKKDNIEFVHKCKECQTPGDFIHAPSTSFFHTRFRPSNSSSSLAEANSKKHSDHGLRGYANKTSSVELVAQDVTIEEEVAAPTAEDVGDDTQVGGNETSRIDVDLHTVHPNKKVKCSNIFFRDYSNNA
ncbi:hypothetical protein V6N11_067349 [Hibiscus sabdariffa]|uniref:Uncharacterized protein n=1 Tax=Hibiscus sabdariffa TaxID=183260 RepID=A0ABR2SR79_9ROSI